jgi:GntR family transcriptional regulator
VLALRMERAPDAATGLGLAADVELLHLERLRMADDGPLAHDRVWLPADLGRPLLEADFTRSALYDELAAQAGVRLTGGRERITATLPDAATRAMLQLPDGEACLRVERTGLLGERTVEHRVTVVRGDRYAVLADWTAKGYTVGAATG